MYDAPQFRCDEIVEMYAETRDATTRPNTPLGNRLSIAG